MAMTDEHTNPFSTRYVRPGSLAYQFAADASAPRLIERLARRRWWGQVVGAHGSGKSTLLHALVPLLEREGRTVLRHTLHVGQRRIPAAALAGWRSWRATTQLVVDGFEQMAWLARRALQHRCRQTHAGLLVTAHRSMGLPTLVEVRCPLDTARQLVEQLVAERGATISSAEVDDLYAVHDGNVRELFFALYDLWERRHA